MLLDLININNRLVNVREKLVEILSNAIYEIPKFDFCYLYGTYICFVYQI